MILLISGKQGAGKTTLAAAMAKKWSETKGNQAVLINFADSIYDMHNYCIGYLKDHGINRDIVKDGPLLQLLGTEWGRKTISKDIWVNVTKAKIAKLSDPTRNLRQNQLFIIGDCRFPNEITAFPEALKVRLDCDRAVRKYRCSQWRENDTHESETALDDFYGYDFKFNTEIMNVDHCLEVINRGMKV